MCFNVTKTVLSPFWLQLILLDIIIRTLLQQKYIWVLWIKLKKRFVFHATLITKITQLTLINTDDVCQGPTQSMFWVAEYHYVIEKSYRK